MLLLLLLCLCPPSSPQISGDPMIVTVPSEDEVFLPCGEVVLPLNLDWRLEGESDIWLTLKSNFTIHGLEFPSPTFLVLKNLSLEESRQYSCSVDNQTILTDDSGILNITHLSDELVLMECKAPKNWTRLSWHSEEMVVLTAERGAEATHLHTIVIQGITLLHIPSVTWKDSGTYHCTQGGNRTGVHVNVTESLQLPHNIKGFEIFFSHQYWIIVATTLGYVGFCSVVLGCYMHWRRKQRAKREAKNRFFKFSTARNLYIDSNPGQEHDPAVKLSEITYQNVTEITSKGTNTDQYSNKSSFLDDSMDEESYLEPNAEDDKVPAAAYRYENADQIIVDEDGSEDGDCYENANEEMKDGSEGSQSYEDMKGSIYLKTKEEQTSNENEDADSYENMQASIYCIPNHKLDCSKKTIEEQPTPACQDQSIINGMPFTPFDRPGRIKSLGLTQENGDFYMSYENSKV